MRTPLLLLPLVAIGCASSPISQVRFENRPIVVVIDDMKDVPEPPAETEFARAHHFFSMSIAEPIDRALAVEPKSEAANVNALGHVPNSSWYENRDLTPQEVSTGPNGGLGEPEAPYTILSAKRGGKSLGFIIEDANKRKYILKFDERAFPEVKTSANIISQRLLYALGYYVPEDFVRSFPRDALRLESEVELVRADGAKIPLDDKTLTEMLEEELGDASSIRGLFSRLIDGEILGGWEDHGLRDDDPNDVIPHEDRREVRSLHQFFAWLEHTDAKTDNRLDVYVKDDERGTRYVRHYLVDFDKTLGALALTSPRIIDGFAYRLDLGYMFATLPTLGLWARPWERIEMREGLIGVGRYQAEIFEPDEWVPHFPSEPFQKRTRYDDFWAASVLARVTPEHVKAAVLAARMSDPASAEYLEKTLLQRREKILRYGLSRVTPLDGFAIEDQGDRLRLCFDDLWTQQGFGAPGHFSAFVYDTDGVEIGSTWWSADGGHTCAEAVPTSGTDYQIVVVEMLRDGETFEPIEVHLGRHPDTSALRIIGVVRAP